MVMVRLFGKLLLKRSFTVDSDSYESTDKTQKKTRMGEDPNFTDCTDIFDIEDLPNTLAEFFLKVSDDLLLQFHLDMFYRWRLYPIVMIDGLPFRDSWQNIGVASIKWINDYFNDEQFEGYNRFA